MAVLSSLVAASETEDFNVGHLGSMFLISLHTNQTFFQRYKLNYSSTEHSVPHKALPSLPRKSPQGLVQRIQLTTKWSSADTFTPICTRAPAQNLWSQGWWYDHKIARWPLTQGDPVLMTMRNAWVVLCCLGRLGQTSDNIIPIRSASRRMFLSFPTVQQSQREHCRFTSRSTLESVGGSFLSPRRLNVLNCSLVHTHKQTEDSFLIHEMPRPLGCLVHWKNFTNKAQSLGFVSIPTYPISSWGPVLVGKTTPWSRRLVQKP